MRDRKRTEAEAFCFVQASQPALEVFRRGKSVLNGKLEIRLDLDQRKLVIWLPKQ
jgi:hypothetical protein